MAEVLAVSKDIKQPTQLAALSVIGLIIIGLLNCLCNITPIADLLNGLIVTVLSVLALRSQSQSLLSRKPKLKKISGRTNVVREESRRKAKGHRRELFDQELNS